MMVHIVAIAGTAGTHGKAGTYVRAGTQEWLSVHVIYVQGGVTPITSVLQSATTVKTKVNGQLEIFTIVNS